MESVLCAWADTKAPHPLHHPNPRNTGYTSFEAQPDDQSYYHDTQQDSAPPDTTGRKPKPHRKQVSRACDWCRAKRIKCDDQIPCQACIHRGAECTVRGSQQARTLPQATKEILRLKARCSWLEAELEKYKKAALANSDALLPSPSASPPDQETGHHLDGAERETDEHHGGACWEGIYTASARTDQVSYYGPSSLLFFINRIGSFLSQPLQQPFGPRNIQTYNIRGVSRTLESPAGTGAGVIVSSPAASIFNPSMSRQQEEYFINIFWEGYHALLPIVEEVDFRKHYDSLWEDGKVQRKDSGVVDIVIALCMQHGYTWLVGNTSTEPGQKATSDDATIAGRWYFRRCQALLAADMEGPNIATIQCLIFSIVYLCCASFQNMAHITMAQAVRAAQIVGLHLEPPKDMPLGQQELRKRVWWVLLTIETKTCVKLGRPFATLRRQATVSLPSDNVNLETVKESSLGSFAGVSYLSYCVHMQKFVNHIADIYHPLCRLFGKLEGSKGVGSIYSEPKCLEECASWLATKAHHLTEWAQSVPEGLKIKHRNGAEPFSFDRSPLNIEENAPRWIRGQKVCMELVYHAMSFTLYRPFVVFSKSHVATPVSDRHATTCVNHAIAHTLIMHQAVTETNTLSGWNEYFVWQWNASITLVGFVLANPIHPCTPQAKQAIDKAIEIFETFGVNYAVAASAAAIAKDFKGKIGIMSDKLKMGMAGGMTTMGTPESLGSDGLQNAGTPAARQDVSDDMSWLDVNDNETDFSNLMDWALSIDSFGSLEKLNNGNSSDFWKIGQ